LTLDEYLVLSKTPNKEAFLFLSCFAFLVYLCWLSFSSSFYLQNKFNAFTLQ